jgi:hypothetical protein
MTALVKAVIERVRGETPERAGGRPDRSGRLCKIPDHGLRKPAARSVCSHHWISAAGTSPGGGPP